MNTGPCAETDCNLRTRPGSDWCAEHGNGCEECFRPVADGEDFCNDHFDPEANIKDGYRSEHRTKYEYPEYAVRTER